MASRNFMNTSKALSHSGIAKMNVDDPKKIRVAILEMVHKAREGHIPSAYSIVELLYVLYTKMDQANDTFFLSKGHASAGLYAALVHFGLLDREELETFAKYNSKLGGHPHRHVKGVMVSTGSLGHGFPMAAGYALGKKIRKEAGTVYCIVGDGETNEGTIWETAMYAEQLKLSNLVCIIDENNSQIRAMTSINIPEKFKAFGWDVQEVDGHDIEAIDRVLFGASKTNGPRCIVAHTVKGKGIKVMEDDFFSWHHKAPTDEEFVAFKQELLA
jgi:transketolase